MKPIFKTYKWLKAKSRETRYELSSPTEREVEQSRTKVCQIHKFVNRAVNQVN